MPAGTKRASRAGQHCSSGSALVELAVGLIVLLVLLAGLVQVGTMTTAHTQTMIKARQLAGLGAMADSYVGSVGVQYIFDWSPGEDEVEYTVDDTAISTTNSADSIAALMNVAQPSLLSELVPFNTISMLGQSDNFANELFLLKGQNSDSIETLPLIRNLIYNKPSITVRSEVWLPWTKGIY